jgi:hypothetical protein
MEKLFAHPDQTLGYLQTMMGSCFASLQELVHKAPAMQDWQRWVFPPSGSMPPQTTPTNSSPVNPGPSPGATGNTSSSPGFPMNLPSPPFSFPNYPTTTANLFPPPQSAPNTTAQPSTNPFNAQMSSNLFSGSGQNPFLIPPPNVDILFPSPPSTNPFPPSPFIFSPLQTPSTTSSISPQPIPNPFASPQSTPNPFSPAPSIPFPEPKPDPTPEPKPDHADPAAVTDPWGVNIIQNWFKNVLPNYISSEQFLADKYKNELKILEEMGWTDSRGVCLKALQQCNGDVMTAIELLLANQTSNVSFL